MSQIRSSCPCIEEDQDRLNALQSSIHDCETAPALCGTRPGSAAFSGRVTRRHWKASRAIEGEKTIALFVTQLDVRLNQMKTWKAQIEGGTTDVFDVGNGSSPTAQFAVDVRRLHVKIDEPTLGNYSGLPVPRVP